MQLETEQDKTFRHEVRSFLRDRLPKDLAERNRRGFKPYKDDVRFWTRILFEKGWSVPSWPREYGGPGWSLIQLQIFEEESLSAGAPLPSPQGLQLVGPTVYTYGTLDQKNKFLPPIRRGEQFWAQGFSEPNAGSDLGSLQTRAVKVGSDYVINGQKIWTSDAKESEWLFLLARTEQKDNKNAISFILVDLASPGITIRPIESIDGGSHLNEVFLEDVHVPCENLLGEEGKGWSYAKFLLAHERSTSAVVAQCTFGLTRLKEIAHQLMKERKSKIDSSVLGSQIARLEIDLLAHEMSTLRAIGEFEAGTDGGVLISSTLKIRGSELLQRIGALTVDVLGGDALPMYVREGTLSSVIDRRPIANYAAGVGADFMYRRAGSIFGGSNEIQRNILGKALLRQ